MTSEVAVLNKTAVALAADSKMTTGHSGREKTYDTVNKLFTLSKYHPVGIMIYGNAEFMSYPWETVIKLYRQQLGTDSRDTIKNYADDFLEYLLNAFSFSNDDINQNVATIFTSTLLDLRESALARVMRSRQSGNRRIKQIISEHIEQYRDYLQDAEVLDYGANLTERKVSQLYSRQMNETINQVFGVLVTSAMKKLLRETCRLLLLKDEFSPVSTGIVIAGFGNEERFPSLIAYDLDGVIAARIKKQEKDYTDVSRQMRGAIVPFAQRDMVFRFMEGVDPNYMNYLVGKMVSLFMTNSMSVIEEHVTGTKAEKEAIKKSVKRALLTNLRDFAGEVNDYRKEKYVDKILDTIIVLPKEELAVLAEALVSITALSRRVAADVESVGGPIDVAIISKGDGFIWVKRKHYFSPELNPWFFRNYLRTGEEARRGGDTDDS